MKSMTNNDDDFASFTFDFSDQFKLNKRVGIRYPAPPANLTLRKCSLLSLGSEITATLVDISAKGALVNCNQALIVKTKLELKIVFAEGTSFKLKGIVIREKSPQHYGIKFDHFNTTLDDFLYKMLQLKHKK